MARTRRIVSVFLVILAIPQIQTKMNIGNILIRILTAPDETNASLFVGLPTGLERSTGQQPYA